MPQQVCLYPPTAKALCDDCSAPKSGSILITRSNPVRKVCAEMHSVAPQATRFDSLHPLQRRLRGASLGEKVRFPPSAPNLDWED